MLSPEKILIEKVIRLIEIQSNNFSRKQEQNILFQVQTIFINKVFEKLNNNSFVNDESLENLVETYYDLKKKANNIGKSYKSILLEKVFTDEYRFFEELIHDAFYILYENFPKLLVVKLNDEVKLQFNDIYLNEDINAFHENFKVNFIEKKIMRDIQGNHIVNILGKFKTKFAINFNLSSDEKKEIYRLAQIRNIITHNDGIINNVYLTSLKKFKITSKFQLGEQVGQYLEDEFKQEHEMLTKLAKRLVKCIIRDVSLVKQLNDNKK